MDLYRYITPILCTFRSVYLELLVLDQKPGCVIIIFALKCSELVNSDVTIGFSAKFRSRCTFLDSGGPQLHPILREKGVPCTVARSPTGKVNRHFWSKILGMDKFGRHHRIQREILV